MGTWGFGPFDSDDGLDFVDNLYDALAPDVSSEDPSTVDSAQVDQAHLKELLRWHMLMSENAIRYVCAGLVVAKLIDISNWQEKPTSVGPFTTPEPTIPNLFAYGTDYVNLISQDCAESLRVEAGNVLKHLERDKEWVSLWVNPDGWDEAIAVLLSATDWKPADTGA